MSLSAVIYGLSGTALTPEEKAFFRDANPYGFILFARNCESPLQVKQLVLSLKDIAGRDRLPILIDQEGGRVARLKPPHWPEFPPASMFAGLASRDRSQAAQAVRLNAQLIAHELYALGITVDCAPVADIPVTGAHDVIGDRAFGHTPEQVALLARAQAEGLMAGGIVPVVKHIPGHGRAGVDSHHELPMVNTTLEELRRTDFAPFAALADLPMAMTAHVLYTAIDSEHLATVSPAVIRLIREEIKFKGLLMSDDLSMKAMKGDFTERAQQTLDAGCDVVLHCNGDMREMRAVAKGVTILSGQALARAGRAMIALTPQPFDVAEARADIKRMLTKAA